MGSSVFVFAETSNAIHGNRGVPLARLAGSARRANGSSFGERMTEVADYIAAQGLRFAYHHHLGTVVESADELDLFLQHTGP